MIGLLRFYCSYLIFYFIYCYKNYISNLIQHTSIECTTTDDNMFQCNDGSCVPIAKYCDFKPDCEDSSDEYMCGKYQGPYECVV